MWFYVKGEAVPCMAVDLLERLKNSDNVELEETVARNATAIAYAGKLIRAGH